MYGTLQSCRAFAAMLVVLFHLGVVIELDKYFGATWVSRPFSFGNAGVDFFFVLSGFIICLVHVRDLGRPERLLNFMYKRLVRIYPTYWIVFLGVYVSALVIPSLRQAMPTEPGVLLASLLLLPQDPETVGGTGAPVLIVAWSLQYEMFFYLLVAAMILNRVTGWFLVACVAVLCMFRPFDDHFPWSFIQADWLPLFAAGACVALLHASSMRVRHPLAWALAGLLVFLGNGMCVVLLPSADQGRAVHYVYALASGMMIFGLVRAEQAGRADALKPRWAQLLGDASYSLYLIHFPLVSVLCKIARAAGLAGNAGAAIAFVVGAAVCVAASMAFHMIVERPLLSLLGSRLGTGKTTVGIAAS